MTKQCSSCGGDCGNVCQRENVTQPAQEPDYLMAPSGRCHAPGGKKPLTAGHADNTYIKLWTRPPVQRQPLTEMDITAIAYSCRNNDAIHYVIAIARAVEAAHGIGGATK